MLYGYAFVFWSGFTLHGLIVGAPDLPAFAATVGPFYWQHAVVQTVGAILFGWAVIRAAVLPRWTGGLLLLAMVAHLTLPVLGLPETYRWIASSLQNLAFMSMGGVLLAGRTAAPSRPIRSSASEPV